MVLTNVANDSPLGIWYDWRDDGDDPKEAEHRFGIVRRKPTGDAKQPFEPKPAYTALVSVISPETEKPEVASNNFLQTCNEEVQRHAICP